jgi:hypothetical protein
VALPALPSVAAVSPGTANLTVATGATVSASPGHFATISIGTGGTLKLAAGAYDLSNLNMSSGAKLQALGAVQIHVASRVSTSSGAVIGPASGVTLTAGGIRLEVSGQNGTTGDLTATPAAAAFGTGNNVTALILVPNGTLVFGTGAVATGAFMGRDVDLGGSGATITYQDGFGGGSGSCTAPSCDDGNPCTVDTCGASGACTHAPAATGTSCSDDNACNGAETCDGAESCKAGTPIVCAAQDQCHTAGSCNATTGICSNPAAANGLACNDGNACTRRYLPGRRVHGREPGGLRGAGSVPWGRSVQSVDGRLLESGRCKRDGLQRRERLHASGQLPSGHLYREPGHLRGAGSVSCGGNLQPGDRHLLESGGGERDGLQRWQCLHASRQLPGWRLYREPGDLRGPGSVPRGWDLQSRQRHLLEPDPGQRLGLRRRQQLHQRRQLPRR